MALYTVIGKVAGVCADMSSRIVVNIGFSFFHSIITFASLRSGPEVTKLFSCSTQLSMKFIMLITIVGILTFISMINTTSDSTSCKQEKSLFFSNLVL